MKFDAAATKIVEVDAKADAATKKVADETARAKAAEIELAEIFGKKTCELQKTHSDDLAAQGKINTALAVQGTENATAIKALQERKLLKFYLQAGGGGALSFDTEEIRSYGLLDVTFETWIRSTGMGGGSAVVDLGATLVLNNTKGGFNLGVGYVNEFSTGWAAGVVGRFRWMGFSDNPNATSTSLGIDAIVRYMSPASIGAFLNLSPVTVTWGGAPGEPSMDRSVFSPAFVIGLQGLLN